MVSGELGDDVNGEGRKVGEGLAVFAFEVVTQVEDSGDGADELDALLARGTGGDADEDRGVGRLVGAGAEARGVVDVDLGGQAADGWGGFGRGKGDAGPMMGIAGFIRAPW